MKDAQEQLTANCSVLFVRDQSTLCIYHVKLSIFNYIVLLCVVCTISLVHCVICLTDLSVFWLSNHYFVSVLYLFILLFVKLLIAIVTQTHFAKPLNKVLCTSSSFIFQVLAIVASVFGC